MSTDASPDPETAAAETLEAVDEQIQASLDLDRQDRAFLSAYPTVMAELREWQTLEVSNRVALSRDKVIVAINGRLERAMRRDLPANLD